MANHRKPKRLIQLIVAGLLIISIAGLIYLFLKPDSEQPNYITATAKIADIENTVLAAGVLEAVKRVDVGAQVSGEVTNLYVDIGDAIKKGQPIAQINAVTQKNTLLNKQADLNQANAQLQSNQANLQLAQTKLDRLKSLIEQNAISKQEYDEALNQVAAAKASLSSSQALLSQAKAEVSTAKQNLAYTKITAPISGTVVDVVTEQGQTLNANQSTPTIVTLADLTKLRVRAQISEADVINLSNGMPVYFTILGAPEKRYNATLEAIEPAPQSSGNDAADAAVYYIGYFDVPNNGELRIGMTAQVYVVVDSAKNTLVIPASAITTRNGKHFVSVIPKSAKNNQERQSTIEPVEKNVAVGINNRVNAQILSGLNAGDTIILSNDAENAGQNRRRMSMM